MDNSIDRSNVQSTGGEKPEKDTAVGVPQQVAADPGGQVGHQKAATGTIGMPFGAQAENRPANGDGSQFKSPASAGDEPCIRPLAGVPQEAAPVSGGQDESQDAATETLSPPSMALAEDRPTNGKGSQFESPTSTEPEYTPLLDLVRRTEDREIVWVRMVTDGNTIHYSEVRKGWDDVRLGPRLYSSLTLPTRPRKCGSPRELFNSVVALFSNHAMLAEKECSLLAYWSIATWFVDFLPFFPSLAITGPAFSADLLFRTLAAVCRRPIPLVDANASILRALPFDELRPTLLLREPLLNKRLAALFDASCQPGYLVFNGKDFQKFYCAKCIYMGERADNNRLTPTYIHVHVGGNARRLLPSPPSDDVIDDFQGRLLTYRFTYHDLVVSSKTSDPRFQFRPEVSAIAQALSAPVEHDPELRRGVFELLPERDQQSRVDRACGQDGMVLKALLSHCHQPEEQRVFVHEIATTANAMREEGELKISNEAVGHVLKNLGLYTRRLGSTGRGLLLDKALQLRAHELGYANEVLTEDPDGSACGYCHNLQVSETQ